MNYVHGIKSDSIKRLRFRDLECGSSGRAQLLHVYGPGFDPQLHLAPAAEMMQKVKI